MERLDKRDPSLKRTIIEVTKAEYVASRAQAKREGFRSVGKWFGSIVRERLRRAKRKG